MAISIPLPGGGFGIRRNDSQPGNPDNCPAFVAAEQRQRDDAHGLLRVVSAVAEAHPGRAQQLASAEDDLVPCGLQFRSSTIAGP